MGNAINNTDLTDGVNVKDPYIGLSCFFIDSTKVFTQDLVTQAFGPKDVNKFKTSSTISFSGHTNVYAMCSGDVVIQSQLDNLGSPEGSDLVNVIIKPYIQPILGLNIKYIVYRGLNKSDFIEPSSGNIQYTGSDLITNMNAEFYGLKDSNVDFLPFYAGLANNAVDILKVPDNMLLEEMFQNDSTYFDTVTNEIKEDPNKAYMLPPVSIGETIGTASGELSIDIVLDDFDATNMNGFSSPFKFDLKFARSSNHYIDLTQGTLSVREKGMMREASSQFMDLSSFLGIHANGHSSLYLNGTDTLEDDASSIYNLMTPLATKNTIYLTILTHRGRSYNYYGQHNHSNNAPENIKLGFETNSLAPKKFGKFDWPIELIDGTQNILPEKELVFSLYAKLRARNKFYSLIGQFNSSNNNGFIIQTNSEFISEGYTEPLAFDLVAVNNTCVSQYNVLIYEDTDLVIQDVTNLNGILYSTTLILNDFQNIFKIGANFPVLSAPNSAEYVQLKNINLNFSFLSSYSSESISFGKRVSENFIEANGSKFDRITYESGIFSSYDLNSSINPTILENTYNQLRFSEFGKEYYNIETPNRMVFTDNPISNDSAITAIQIEDENGEIPGKFMLGLTGDQETKILTELQNNSIYNASIYIYDENNSQIDYDLDNQPDFTLKQFKIAIIGETESNLTHIHYFSEPIEIYTIENRFFASKEYIESTHLLDRITSKDLANLVPSAPLDIIPAVQNPPDPSTVSSFTEGALLKDGRLVSLESFISYSLDDEGFLYKFTDKNGEEFRWFHRNYLSAYLKESNEIDDGGYFRVATYISSIDTSDFPIYEYNFRLLEVGKTVIVTKVDYNSFNLNYVKIKRMSLTQVSSFPVWRYTYLNEDLTIDESYFSELDSDLAVDFDQYAEGFVDRHKSNSFFTSLSAVEKPIFFKAIVKIALQIKRFTDETKGIILDGDTSPELTALIDSVLVDLRDNRLVTTLESLDIYLYILKSANTAIYYEKANFRLLNADRKIASLYTFPMFADLFVTFPQRLETLKTYASAFKLYASEQTVVMNILSQSFGNPTEADAILEFFLSKNEMYSTNYRTVTNFKVFMGFMKEIAWFDGFPVLEGLLDMEPRAERTNRRGFIFILVKLWESSKFYPLYYDSLGELQEKSASAYAFSSVEHDIPYLIFNTDKEDEFTVDYVDYQARKNLTGANGDRVIFDEVIYTPIIDEDGKTTEEYEKTPTFFSTFNLMEPIRVLGFTPSWELKINDLAGLYPAFLHYYTSSFKELKETNAKINLAINIVFEVVLFFGSGGGSAINYLRWFSKTGKVGRSIYNLSSTTLNFHRAALSAEIGSAVIHNYSFYISQTSPDQETHDLFSNISLLFIGLNIGTGAISARQLKYLQKKSNTILDDFANLTPAQQQVVNMPTELTNLISEFTNVSPAPFQSFLNDPNNGLLTLKSQLDNSLSVSEYNKYFFDFYAKDHTGGLNFWVKLQDNPNHVANWKSLSTRNVSELNHLDVITNNSFTDSYIKFFDSPELLENISKMDVRSRKLLIHGFSLKGISAVDTEITALFNLLKTKPEKLIEFAEASFKVQQKVIDCKHFFVLGNFSPNQINLIYPSLTDGVKKIRKDNLIDIFTLPAEKQKALDFLTDGVNWSKGDIVEIPALETLSRTAPSHEEIYSAVHIRFYKKNGKPNNSQYYELDGLRLDLNTNKFENIISAKFDPNADLRIQKDIDKLLIYMKNIPDSGIELRNYIITNFKLPTRAVNNIVSAKIAYLDPITRRLIEIEPSLFRKKIKSSYNFNDFEVLHVDNFGSTNADDLYESAYQFFNNKFNN